MMDMTRRVRQAAIMHHPALQAVREFAGTMDGVRVIRFRCADGVEVSPFDSSHLDHAHLSFWRSRVHRDHSQLFQIMTGAVANRMKLILVHETGNPAIWLSNLQTRVPVVNTAQLSNILAQGNAPGFWTGDLWQGGTVHTVPVGQLDQWGPDITPVDVVPMEITPEQLAAVSAAAAAGAEAGADGASPEEVKAIIDEQLDQAFRGGADAAV